MILFCISITYWTALTAIGTIAMAIATFCSLRKNDKQVNEMKRQWEEDHRPYLDIKLVYNHNLNSTASRYLQIRNFGKGTANDIQFQLDKDFINNIEIETLKEHLLSLVKDKYRVLPNESINKVFCDIIEHGNSGKCRISSEEFNLNQRSALLKYLDNPITVAVQYTWNGKSYYENFILKYNE